MRLSLGALLCLGGARGAISVGPTAYRVAGARAGVIGQLFPAVAQLVDQPLLRPSFRASSSCHSVP